MKKILIITDLSFPTGSAMASRIRSFCSLFYDVGYSVHVIAGKNEEKTVKKYKDFTYQISQSQRSYGLQSLVGNEVLSIDVENYLNQNPVDLVFLTSLNVNFKKIIYICKKYDKKVLLEQCEWYDPSSFKFGRIDPRYWTFLTNIKRRYLSVDGIIAISRLLEEYYKNKGKEVIRIPSILNVENYSFSLNSNNNKICLVYSGNASKSKELLKPMIEALNDEDLKEYFELNIYGPTKNQVLESIDHNKELLSRNIVMHGKIPQDKMEEVLVNADYQIFIRPNRKSSNAGFPTKLCESMSAGTPVITNNTGDISLYLKDGQNGYICKDITKESIREVLVKIKDINKKEYNGLRNSARQCALKNFDYRNYIDLVKDFVEKI